MNQSILVKVFLFVLLLVSTISFHLLPKINKISSIQQTSIIKLHAKIAKAEEEKVYSTENGELVNLPYDGLVGSNRERLFDEPLEIYDPLKNTNDLPGEDGSEIKINAILAQIEERSQYLKSTGQWIEDDSFSSNPLSYQPIWITMKQQIQAARPFESISELWLTYILVIATTLLLSGYLVFLKEYLNAFVLWFINTDINSDFLNQILRYIAA